MHLRAVNKVRGTKNDERGLEKGKPPEAGKGGASTNATHTLEKTHCPKGEERKRSHVS